MDGKRESQAGIDVKIEGKRESTTYRLLTRVSKGRIGYRW